MAASQIKYGIKLASSEYESGRKKIEAITRFQSGNLLDGFTEIDEKEYADWTTGLTPYHYWDVATETVKKDAETEEEASAAAARDFIRGRLKWLFYEIQFTTELEEDATDLQSEYDDLLEEYNPTEA